MDFKLGTSMNVNLVQHCNQFHVTGLFLTQLKHQKTSSAREAYQDPAKDLRWGFCENSSW